MKNKRLLKGIIIGIILLFVGASIEPSISADWWPMFGHDPNHTRYSTSLTPSSCDVLWIYFENDNIVRSSPAVVDGHVYIGSFDHNVYCLDAETGDLEWNFPTDSYVESSPAVAYGNVYVGSHDHTVYCLDAATGGLVWSYLTGYSVTTSPAIVDGYVYIGSYDHNVYCLDAFGNGDGTTTEVWSYLLEGEYPVNSPSSPAVAYGNVYVGSGNSNQILCLNAETGSLIWSYTTDDEVVSSPAVVNGRLYVGSLDKNVYCLDAVGNGDGTTTKIWNYTTESMVASSPAVANEKIYIASLSGEVYCLDAEGNGDGTTTKIWSYTIEGDIDSSPAVANGKVYLGSWDKNVYCLDAEGNGDGTTTKLWSYETDGRIRTSSPAVVADGKVYIGSEDTQIYCFAGNNNTDDDGDGLPNNWEMYGYDANDDGIIDVDLPAMGADPQHEDIFVEIDWMEDPDTGDTYKPLATSIQKIVDSFDNAPRTNPDGTTGIHLHVDCGPDSPLTWGPSGGTWDVLSGGNALPYAERLGGTGNGYQWDGTTPGVTYFQDLKDTYFSDSRHQIFHYCIFCDRLGFSVDYTGISRNDATSEATARQGASDFVVSLGGGTRGEPGTFMHELGHNLGLLHGGFEHLGYKPNYLSVMNYLFQTKGLIIDRVDGHYDYSRFNLTTLDESHLNEEGGLSDSPEAANYGTKYFDSYGEFYGWKGFIFTVNNINDMIDWDCDGHMPEYSVKANINYDFDNWGNDIYTSAMHGFDDWDNIVFDGGLVGGGMLGEELPLETDMQELILDLTLPSITVEVPESWEALQDGVIFQSYVTDPCGIDWVKYSIREPGGPHGTIIDATYEACAASPTANYRWQLPFDTTELPDAYYVLYVNASDTQGNINNTSVNFSIRNWAILEMLPNTPASKAGRTIPVKFSLRITAAVDPAEPFVRNEDLTIKIYDISTPWNILQQSTYGTHATDYRINSTEEQYITNFHTLKTPTFYVVEIWRGTLLIGNFGFFTIK